MQIISEILFSYPVNIELRLGASIQNIIWYLIKSTELQQNSFPILQQWHSFGSIVTNSILIIDRPWKMLNTYLPWGKVPVASFTNIACLC